MKSLTIGIDFDGTIVKHAYPEIGNPVPDAIETMQELMEAGHKIILYTMRSGERLAEAVEYLEESGIDLYAVNKNPTQHHWTQSPKIFCHLYIDDAALGCPLDKAVSGKGRPWVEWEEVREMLVDTGVIEE